MTSPNHTPDTPHASAEAALDRDDAAAAPVDQSTPSAPDAPAPLLGQARLDLSPSLLPTTWDVAAYGPGLQGPGGAKISTSAVAPLVAVARGYRSVDQSGIDDAFNTYALPRRNTRQGRTLVDSMTRGDVLIMPWFTPDDVEVARRISKPPVPSTIQYRPSNPAVDPETGRELKYEFVSGQHSPIGAHPAMPTEWFNSVPRVLVAEGLLKGDAALTGMLLNAGYTAEDLADLSEDPRKRLTDMLRAIDPDKRVLILTIGGVWSWQKNHEWRSLPLAGREVWVGVDGDVAENPHVHLAATRLWEYIKDYQKATPHLLSPSVTAGDQGQIEKIGIDDYLAQVGTWSSLLAMLSPTLPPAPKGNELANVGKSRISDQGTAMEVCEREEDAFGTLINGKWRESLPLGGRILSVVTERVPTDKEIATGRLDFSAAADAYSWDIEVEVAWADPDGKPVRHVVSGPAAILNYTPDQWDRKGAHIPAPILLHEEWPPTGKDGEAWLKAIKTHKSDETVTRVRWDAMGWVPVDGGAPAFIVGDQVIGGEDTDADILPGVGEHSVSRASKFGVHDIDPRPFDDPGYQAAVRADIEALISTYVRAGAWKDRRKAAVVVAAGLRPCLPIRPHSVLYFTGPPGKGKSFSAAAAMGFWSRNPGDWHGGALPGSAKDTLASMEGSVARTPIFVIDDLAPATSVRQSQVEQDRLYDVIRNVFNGSSKGRMTADMSARKRLLPRALLIVTAENEPAVASVRERVVSVDITFGSLAESRIPTDAVNSLHEKDGAPARVAQALVKYLRYLASRDSSYGWADLYEQVARNYEGAKTLAASIFDSYGAKVGDSKRAADMAGDLIVALTWLSLLAEEVGCDDDLIDLLGAGGLSGDIASLVADGHRSNKETTPGKALLDALAAALRRGRCHIVNGADPATPPGHGDGSSHLTSVLGWQATNDGQWRPMGDTIGYMVHDKARNQDVLLFDSSTAFNVAQQLYPGLVPPGQGPRSSWGSVVGEGLAVDGLLRPDGSGGFLNTARVRAGRITRSGVPVAIGKLFGEDPDVDIDKDAA